MYIKIQINMKLYINTLKFILSCMLIVISVSCDPIQSDDQVDDTTSEITMNTPPKTDIDPAGESMIIGFTASKNWSVNIDVPSDDAWLSVNKTSGQKGSSSVMLTAQPNYTGQARTASMTIVTNADSETMTFVQESVSENDLPTFKILSENTVISSDGGRVEVRLVSLVDYTLKVNDEWVHEVETKGERQITHVFDVDPNPAAQERVAHIAFCTDQLCIPYIITQEGDPNIPEPIDPTENEWTGIVEEGWESMEFAHRPVAMRFTADWCGYCPMMASAFETLSQNLNGNLEVLSLHCAGGLEYSPCTVLERQYRIGGYPSGVIDGMTQIGNYSSPSYTASVAMDAINLTESNFTTETSLSWVSSVKKRKVKTSLSVYLRQPGKYLITALVVEDNIVAYQNGVGDKYVHNGVVRYALSSISGDEYIAESENDVAKLLYSYKVPESYNLDNMRLVVYVQRSMGEKSVLASGNYGGYFIDNSATSKFGESHNIDAKE